MAPEAIITREELACLLATTAGAVTQMSYRGELPSTAFPGKRRACWFVADIRRWLNEMAKISGEPISHETTATVQRRAGRPRLSTESRTR